MNNLTNQTGLEKMVEYLESLVRTADEHHVNWCQGLVSYARDLLKEDRAKSSVGKDAVEVGDMCTADVTIEGKICGILPFKKTLGNVPVKVTHIASTSQDGLREIEVVKKQLAFCQKRYRAVVDELAHPVPQEAQDGKNVPASFVKEMAEAYEMDEFIVRNIIDHYHRQILSKYPIPQDDLREALKAFEMCAKLPIENTRDEASYLCGYADAKAEMSEIISRHPVTKEARDGVVERLLKCETETTGRPCPYKIGGKVVCWDNAAGGGIDLQKCPGNNNESLYHSPVPAPVKEKSLWKIALTGRKNQKEYFFCGKTYAEAEAKARAYLQGLDESKGGK